MELKVIVPVSWLQDDMICYKMTGSKPYVVKRKIRIDDQVIECDKSAVFLVSDGGFTKSYSGDTEVKRIVDTISEIYEYIGEEY